MGKEIRFGLFAGASQEILNHHGNAAPGDGTHVLDPAVHGQCRHALGRIAVHDQAQPFGSDRLDAFEALARRQLPRLPPETAVGVDPVPCGRQCGDENGKTLVEGHSPASRTASELAAQPGIDVVGINLEIVQAR